MSFTVWDFIFSCLSFKTDPPVASYKPLQGPHAASTGPVWGFDGVAPLPRPLTGHKSPHRAEFGFRLLAGASKENNPPFQQSRVKTQTEKKTPLPLFLKINLIKPITPCKQFSNPLKKNPLLCLCGANFAVAHPFAKS